MEIELIPNGQVLTEYNKQLSESANFYKEFLKLVKGELDSLEIRYPIQSKGCIPKPQKVMLSL